MDHRPSPFSLELVSFCHPRESSVGKIYIIVPAVAINGLASLTPTFNIGRTPRTYKWLGSNMQRIRDDFCGHCACSKDVAVRWFAERNAPKTVIHTNLYDDMRLQHLQCHVGLYNPRSEWHFRFDPH
jgi:hypothetical protein